MARGDGRTAESVFADVAMAALGPVAFLMVFFLLIAGQLNGRPACKPLTESQQGEKVEQLRSWLEEQHGRVRTAETRRQRYCPDQQPVWNASGESGVVPWFLANVCPAEREALLLRANSTPEKISDLIARREALDEVLLHCSVREQSEACAPMAQVQRETLTREYRSWVYGLRRDVRTFESRLTEACPTAGRWGTRPNLAAPAMLPSRLLSACQSDSNYLMMRLGLNLGELRALIEKRERLSRELEDCVGELYESQERQAPKTFQVEFRSCSVEFVNTSGQEYSAAETRAYFDRLARQTLEVLQRSDYNRIDIFGHTDARRVLGRCANGATSNKELSALRAMHFAAGLEAALARLNRSVRRRLETGDLRLYGIGVGEKEPVVRNARSESEHRRNRRIELRYVADPFRGGSS